MATEPRARAGRSVVGPICAIGAALFGLCLAPLACLNPFPDDQPSNTPDQSPSVTVGPSGNVPGPVVDIAPPELDDTDDNGEALTPPLTSAPAGGSVESDAGVPEPDGGSDAGTAVVR